MSEIKKELLELIAQSEFDSCFVVLTTSKAPEPQNNCIVYTQGNHHHLAVALGRAVCDDTSTAKLLLKASQFSLYLSDKKGVSYENR